jgi:hypothetical protein
VTVTMFPGSAALEYVDQNPDSSYVVHPELRSSGLIPDPEQ